jgi:hypothetical protein
MLVECFGGCAPAECLAWLAVEHSGDGLEVLGGVWRGLCLLESIGGAGRWCSRSFRAARGFEGHRNRCEVRLRS